MTREEAIARIKEHKIVHKMNEPRAIYISEALDMAIQSLERTEWISVRDRLPKVHQDVLLSLRNLDVVVGFRAETEPYFYCQGDYIEPQNVLAWMPLLEPYKAESEGV